jgi:hypothetical protein
MPPFLEKSTAMWVAIPMLPPLPMNMILLPRSFTRRHILAIFSNATPSGTGSPPVTVHSAPSTALNKVSK